MRLLAALPSEPEAYLPLYRWAESAATVRQSPGRSAWWSWGANIELSVVGWLWQAYQWLADISEAALTTDTTGVSVRMVEASREVVTSWWILLFVAAGLVPLIGWMRKKNSAGEIGKRAALALLFGAAALFALNSSLVNSIVGTARDMVSETTGLAVDFSENWAEERFYAKPVWAPENDYMSCRHLLEYLQEESRDAQPVARIMNIWAMWSYYPFWHKTTYGMRTRGTGDRMGCRELEAGSGAPATEQAEIGLCAIGRVYLKNNPQTQPGTPPDECEQGRNLLGLPPEGIGPWRDTDVLQSASEQTRQAMAWTLCLKPAPGQTQNWFLHPGFANLEIRQPGSTGGSSWTGPIKDVFWGNQTCAAWMQGKGNNPGYLAGCPPWRAPCGVFGSDISAQLSPTFVPPDASVFDSYPQKYLNWGDTDTLVAEAERYIENAASQGFGQLTDGEGNDVNDVKLAAAAAVQEMEEWVQGRGHGTPGHGETLGLFFAMISTFFYLPIAIGAALGFVLSSYMLAVITGAVPLVLMLCMFESGRRFALAVAKFAGWMLMGWIAAVLAMTVFTMLFSWLAGLGPDVSVGDGFAALMWAGLVPLMASKTIGIVSRYSRSEAAKDKSPVSLEGMLHIASSSKRQQDTLGQYTARPRAIAAKGTTPVRSAARTFISAPQRRKDAQANIRAQASPEDLDFAPPDEDENQTQETKLPAKTEKPKTLTEKIKGAPAAAKKKAADAVKQSAPVRSVKEFMDEAKAKMPEEAKGSHKAFLRGTVREKQLGETYTEKSRKATTELEWGGDREKARREAVQSGVEYYTEKARQLSREIIASGGKMSQRDMDTKLQKIRPYRISGEPGSEVGVKNMTAEQKEIDIEARQRVSAVTRRRTRMLKRASRGGLGRHLKKKHEMGKRHQTKQRARKLLRKLEPEQPRQQRTVPKKPKPAKTEAPKPGATAGKASQARTR